MQRGMQLHVRHMAADAIALTAVWLSVVTFGAFLVIESWISATRVLVRHMASRAGQLAGLKALAFDKTKRLKANVLELRIVDWRAVPVTVAA